MLRIQRRAMLTSGGEDDSDSDGEDEHPTRAAPAAAGDATGNIVGADSSGSGRRQRSQRPHSGESNADGAQSKTKKSDPFFKEKQEFATKLSEKERKDQEIKARLAFKKSQKEKRDTSKKNMLYKRTKSGQPVMKGMMEQLLGKIEASSDYKSKSK